MTPEQSKTITNLIREKLPPEITVTDYYDPGSETGRTLIEIELAAYYMLFDEDPELQAKEIATTAQQSIALQFEQTLRRWHLAGQYQPRTIQQIDKALTNGTQ